MIGIVNNGSEGLAEFASRMAEYLHIKMNKAQMAMEKILIEAQEPIAEMIVQIHKSDAFQYCLKLAESIRQLLESNEDKEPYVMPRMSMKPIKVRELLRDKRVRCFIRNWC